MSKLNDLLIAAQQDLPITVRHERWLATHSNVRYPSEHVATIADLLVGGDRERLHSFSSSSTGDCHRKQIFSYLGMQGKGTDASLANIFHTGNFIHLKWQLAGLTEGWLKQIEVPLHSEKYNLKGTMDGILWDNSGFEFKSINSNGFKSVMQFGPKKEHIMQVHAYMLLTGIDAFSVVYENKDNGEWRELRVHRDDETIDLVKKHLVQLNYHLEEKLLPSPLEECKLKEGKYIRCPFKDRCLKVKAWDEINAKN
jgi:hypothetical protein